MNERKIDNIRAQKYPWRIADVVLFAVAVALTVTLLLTLPAKKGNAVEISYGGERIELPLSKDARRDVGGHLSVVVKDGKAWVEDADCKNRICVKTGKISRVGESIVCAQNKIVITVVGKSSLAGTVGQG